ncbi:Thioredoxin [Musa troglodytarum]|uniref:Thioredoxin n=1 Tax=Musa troglodytarum TaxID=320322 RepID=A0A9E7I9X8_9LILI|nr:Thioredoxin [Musa troglodytarum]
MGLVQELPAKTTAARPGAALPSSAFHPSSSSPSTGAPLTRARTRAAAVDYQACNILPRTPMEGQLGSRTAQGRVDPNQNTSISIHNWNIKPDGNVAGVKMYLEPKYGLPNQVSHCITTYRCFPSSSPCKKLQKSEIASLSFSLLLQDDKWKVGTERKERGVGSVEVLGGKNEFKGRQIVVKNQSSSDGWNPKDHSHCSIHASICLPRAMKWWEKSIVPNMTEITSSDHLVESLATAGDKLVIVDFYSPGCGGCKALHPKICQLAESNPDAIFLKVNYEEHKSMCHGLRIHVLPFFRLYRGAHGRVCSFSCTNATVKKLKDAMAKHGTERCSLGPAKGLEKEELLVLAPNRGARFNRPPALSSI